MTFVLAWIAFPVVLVALALGCGALLERAGGVRLAGALLVPAGLAVIVCATLLATALDATAELATPLVVVLAVAGLAVGRPWRGRRLDGWALAAGAGAFAVFAAPVVLSGAPTFAGYIKLDDTATWFAFVDHVMEHGRDVTMLPDSSYEANLEFFIADRGYPLGSLTPLGAAAPLVATDVAWVFQPFMAFLAGVLALAAYALLAPVVASRPARALGAFVAAQPALLFAYGQWGGVKEVAAAAALATLAALAAPVLARGAPLRAGVPFAVAAASLLGVLGPAAAPWILVAAALALVVAWRASRSAPGRLAAQTGIAAAVGALAALPSLVLAGTALASPDLYTSGLDAGEGLGNLIEPLSALQALGPWPTADFRLDPDSWPLAVVLLLATAAAAILGASLAWRRRAWPLLVYAVSAAAGAVVVLVLAKPWVDAKALTIAAPAVLALAMAGATGTLAAPRSGGATRADAAGGSGRTWLRVAGGVLAVVVGAGVLWSNALAYGKVNLAPRERLAELERVGEHVAGKGPTLLTEPEFYGARHFLREGDPEGAADFRRRQVPLADAAVLLKDAWADLDGFSRAAFAPYRTLVVRRSPVDSRPPADFRRTFRGDWYEVWERDDRVRVLEHLPLGADPRAARCGPIRMADLSETRLPACPVQPAAVPRCEEIERLAVRALDAGGRLVAARRQAPVVVDLTRATYPRSWPSAPAQRLLYPDSPGVVTAVAQVPRSGRYAVWAGGSFGRGVTVSLDGRALGSVRDQLSNRGQFVPVGTVALRAGTHGLAVRFPDASLRPGSAETRHPLGPIVLEPARGATLEEVAPERARELCGQSLDWVEVVAGGSERPAP